MSFHIVSFVFHFDLQSLLARRTVTLVSFTSEMELASVKLPLAGVADQGEPGMKISAAATPFFAGGRTTPVKEVCVQKH